MDISSVPTTKTTLKPPRATVGEERLLLQNIDWETYLTWSEARRGSVPRMTYDRGVLELMNPRRQHEELSRFLGRLVETYTEVRGIEVRSVASTTFRRPELLRGFEADESYYISNVEAIWRKPEVDLSIDPPPDLVIEVEITSSVIAKMPLFAAMKIPEVWRHDEEHLEMLVLTDGEYQPIKQSRELPGLTIAMIESVIDRRFEVGETQLIRDFRRSIGG